ncbi:hypothetical protein PFISCL1PPCAC_24668, partial [Pristionchus fissidentatus]
FLMNDWEDVESKKAKRRKIYAEMRDCMKMIKDRVDDEQTIKNYIFLLTRFIRGRSSLMEIDEFATKNLPMKVRESHETLFTHLLDGSQVPIGKAAMEEKTGKKKEHVIPSESLITVHLYLMGAVEGINEIDEDSGTIIRDALNFHLKGIIEDAVKVRLPYLVSPSGSLRLNTTTDPTAQRARHKITMRDVRDGIEMADGTALWVQFASKEMRDKLRRRFAELK